MGRLIALVLAAFCCLPLVCGSRASAQEKDASHRDEVVGAVLHVSGPEWKRTTGSQGSIRWVTFDNKVNKGTRLSLQTVSLPPEVGSLAQLCDSELAHWRSAGAVDELSREERTVADVDRGHHTIGPWIPWPQGWSLIPSPCRNWYVPRSMVGLARPVTSSALKGSTFHWIAER